MQNFAFCNHLKRKKFSRGAYFCEYQLNRAGGKRNSLLSTFVFRPLTHRTHSSAFDQYSLLLLQQILYPYLEILPTFPYAHAYPPAQRTIGWSRRKYLRYTLLDDAVHQRRNTQFAHLAIVFRYKFTFGRFLSPFSNGEGIHRHVVCQVVQYGGRGQPTASGSGRCLPETSSPGSEDAGNGRRAERSAAE